MIIKVKMLIILFLVASIGICFGQPPPPGLVSTPIDGGITFLLAAGALYGAKKIRDHRRTKP